MIDVNILTNGLSHYKSRAFLLPLIRNSDNIRNRGINVEIYEERTEELVNCNVLIIEDRFYTYDELRDKTPQGMIGELSDFSRYVNRLLWFDTTDSTGTLTTSVIPVVDGYYKKQLLKDRTRYLKPMHGGRLYTHYYHEEFDVKDENQWLETVESKSDLDKLGIFWTLGPNMYFPWTSPEHTEYVGRLLENIPRSILALMPWNEVLESGLFWKKAQDARTTDVSARFSTSYNRSTVQFHRKQVQRNLPNQINTEMTSITGYWSEIRNSKIVVSPFGYGEVCHRDFEAFMSGCLLAKPSMDHIETWPSLYEDGETIVSFNWDASDIGETLQKYLTRPEEAKRIAQSGQDRYREYLAGDLMGCEFVNRFEDIVRP